MMDRLAIGGNRPPPHDAFALHIEELFSLVSGSLAAGAVENDEQETALDKLMDDVRQARKDADDLRIAEKRPHDEAAKAVQAKWKPLLDRCDTGLKAIKDALTPYREASQRAKDAATQQAREAAEEQARIAREAYQASDDLEARFAAEQQIKQAGKLAAVANRIDRAPTGLRTYWEAEVTDRRAALNHYIKINPDAFTALIQQLADADARGTRAPVPGVIFHERKKAA